jgi:hypothetical protein
MSAVREVPDNQEVWADGGASDASLIIELVERVEHLPVRARTARACVCFAVGPARAATSRCA